MKTSKETLLNDLTVVNFKQHKGHDGYGFNLDLKYKGKKIVHVFDDNWGGGYRYTVLGAIDTTARKENKKLYQELEAKIKGLPKWKSRFGDGEMDMHIDILMDDLVNKQLLKKDEKKGIVYHEKDKSHRIQIMGYSVQIPTLLKDEKNKVHYISEFQKDVDKLKKENAVILNAEYLTSIGVNI